MSDSINALLTTLQNQGPATVLTGAGVSVDSGLPVYRDSKGDWVHQKPIDGRDFKSSATVRQRYWCRSFIGWPSFSKAQPNSAHHDLTKLINHGHVSNIITQNVDGLHQKANSLPTTALHGNLGEVICLGCGEISSRDSLQHRMRTENPEFSQQNFEVKPDGDANVDSRYIENFKVSDCINCNGTLKPHVVFFGETVPVARVEHCMENLTQSKLLLCIGTSLMVYSGFRFCRKAHSENIPIAIINEGVTRADDIATIKIEAPCATVLSQLHTALSQ